jgi:hypothetical protein
MNVKPLCFAIALLPACTNTPAPEGAPAPTGDPTQAAPAPAPNTSATASPPLAPAATVAGTWISPSCGARTYERRLVLDPAGTFTAEDRVSPCPPNVACVWSGIVYARGTYTVTSGRIQLTTEGSRPPAKPLPATLVIDPATGAPAEVEDGLRCVYTRAPR